jgi:hypothetical protein
MNVCRDTRYPALWIDDCRESVEPTEETGKAGVTVSANPTARAVTKEWAMIG